ncbi:hypothetical protein MASR2M18_00350 [Ignavibacteria bacterium]|nr:hypothetical protein [Bacteroidota bacterium]MCZ2131908.1 hypothetical protein [Bacteroidota bacterium]
MAASALAIESLIAALSTVGAGGGGGAGSTTGGGGGGAGSSVFFSQPTAINATATVRLNALIALENIIQIPLNLLK